MVGDKNPKCNYGFTPFHFAAEYGHLDLCKHISNSLENMDPKSTFGYTPLHKASKNGHKQVVLYLSNFVTSNDDMCNIWGETPLSYLP